MTAQRRSTWVVIACLVTLALSAAGCGSSGSHPTTSTPSAPVTTAAATTDTSASPAGAGALGALGALASVAHCSAFAKLEVALEKAVASGGGSLAANAAEVQRLAAQSPLAVRADVEVIASAFAKLARSSSAKGGQTTNPAAQLAALAGLASGLSSPPVKRAESAVEAWAARGCKS